jgi:hypothetical protein
MAKHDFLSIDFGLSYLCTANPQNQRGPRRNSDVRPTSRWIAGRFPLQWQMTL